MCWVLDHREGERTTVRLQPVHDGQDRIVVRLFRQVLGTGGHQKIGELLFKSNVDGFLEKQELEAHVRFDLRGRLCVQLTGEGKPVQKRFTIPNDAMKPAKVRKSTSRNVSPGYKEVTTSWMKPVTLVLFTVAAACIITSLVIIIAKGW